MERILVTGTHRSGTTWVGRMLSVNEDVAYVHEPFNVKLSRDKYSLPIDLWYTYVPDLVDKEAFHKSFQRILTFGVYPRYPDDYAWHFALRCRIRDRIKHRMMRRGASAILIKDPIALLSADHLARRHQLRVVCMIRHPLGFCGSIKKWGWEFPFEHLLLQHRLIEERLSDYRSAIQMFASSRQSIVDQAILLWKVFHHVIRYYQDTHPNWIFLRHEDVLRSPVCAFRDLYAELGIGYSEICDQAIAASLISDKGDPDEPAFTAREKSAVLSSWKSRLTPQEVEKIERESFDLRRHFYPPSTYSS